MLLFRLMPLRNMHNVVLLFSNLCHLICVLCFLLLYVWKQVSYAIILLIYWLRLLLVLCLKWLIFVGCYGSKWFSFHRWTAHGGHSGSFIHCCWRSWWYSLEAIIILKHLFYLIVVILINLLSLDLFMFLGLELKVCAAILVIDKFHRLISHWFLAIHKFLLIQDIT